MNDFIKGLEKGLPNSPKKNSLMAFLALKDEIQKSLDEGYQMKYLHSLLFESQKLNISYAQFTRYVNKHIKEKKLTPKDEVKTESEESKATQNPTNDLSLTDVQKLLKERKKYDENSSD